MNPEIKGSRIEMPAADYRRLYELSRRPNDWVTGAQLNSSIPDLPALASQSLPNLVSLGLVERSGPPIEMGLHLRPFSPPKYRVTREGLVLVQKVKNEA